MTTTQHITERAMLVKISIHQWTARRHDKKVSDEVAQRHGSDSSMGAYQKDLVARSSLKEICELSSQIRNALYKRTLPWLDDGCRILPATFYFDAMAEWKDLIHKREAKVGEFIDQWDAIVGDARQRLNGLFNETDYPRKERLERAFQVDLTVFPMPAGNDFRVPLGKAEEEAQIRTQVEDRVNELLQKATRDVWQRIHEVVERMAERLRAYAVGPDNKVVSTFRDSLVENVRDLVELLPGLNVAGDAELDAMTDHLRTSLTVYDADQLRESAELRDIVATRAENVLKSVSDFLA
jgi:hypothetical protein